ncbi:MAG TPA: alpha/beta fold hydrolase [Baekduia sp.]|nr:alpha/beta fold hydrolase [Baekduia sp.]
MRCASGWSARASRSRSSSRARARPERSPYGPAPRAARLRPLRDEAQTAMRRAAIALLREERFAEVVEQSFPRLVHPLRVDDAALRAIQLDMLRDTGAEAAIRQQTAIIHRPDARPGLADVDVPALVLVGDSDQITPPERAVELAAGIAGARLVTVPECGHLSTFERPEAVTRALVEWLSA